MSSNGSDIATGPRATLREVIVAATRGRGYASVSIIARPDAEPETVWTPDAADEPAFLAYSITKTFTAALILMLSEENLLRIEDPVARWVPRIAHADRITLRRLLNHTAGIPDYGRIRAYHDDLRASPSTPWSFDRYAAETFDKGLDFEPGQGWVYSNPGYMLLKVILEHETGRRAHPRRGLSARLSHQPRSAAERSWPSPFRISALSHREHRARSTSTAPRAMCVRTTILAGYRTAS